MLNWRVLSYLEACMEYTKPALTYERQADLAISKGLGADRDELVACLESIGYYRLSGYWHILKDPATGLFHENATLGRVLDLYSFDRQLKLLVFDAVERVEVYLRSQLAYELAHDGGSFGYLRPENLPNLDEAAYDGLMSRCRKSFKRSRVARLRAALQADLRGPTRAAPVLDDGEHGGLRHGFHPVPRRAEPHPQEDRGRFRAWLRGCWTRGFWR